MIDTELLPCPFCGHQPDPTDPFTFWLGEGDKWGAVQCRCGCIGPDIRTGYYPLEEWKADAIAEWNKRVAPVPFEPQEAV